MLFRQTSLLATKHFPITPRHVRFMGVRPELAQGEAKPVRHKMTIQRLRSMRSKGIPITTLTAYDYPTGRQCENNGVDICLVGDSLAQVCLGYESTTKLTLDEMIHHCKAVVRGCKTPFLVADMPFGTYHISIPDAIRNAVRLIQEGSMECVKLEGGVDVIPIVKSLTSVGIPVMAHVGLLPQRHVSLSGYKVQGKTARSAFELLQAAQGLQEAGACSIVLEAVPHALAEDITKKLDIPTIGIGAGPECSGQVLVWNDAMGSWAGHQAKFVRRFAELDVHASDGVKAYVDAVRSRTFPNADSEGYEIPEAEWTEYLKLSN
ncbi:hypothetical protein M422DRAFT_244556 [Sphaerobolus stellatus SS14]|nr:hypothetical protein M422DRAFT_244556 [Sphaerobolus stellatus SS14]